MGFAQVPRSLIEDIGISDKRVLVYLTMQFSMWSGIMIDELTAYCGYSSNNRHSGSAKRQVNDIVQYLQNRGYITIAGGRLIVKKRNDCFGAIYDDEFELIMRSRETTIPYGCKINHAHLLLMLACIRCHMAHAYNEPQMYSNLLKRISDSIGISVRSVSNCARVLEDLEIIHSEELPRYKDGQGNWHSNVRIFVNRQNRNSIDHTYDWQKETKRGINMILANQQC